MTTPTTNPHISVFLPDKPDPEKTAAQSANQWFLKLPVSDRLAIRAAYAEAKARKERKTI